jgi:hypothetical protein
VARAKNTDRASARRRYRTAQAEAMGLPIEDEDPDAAAPGTSLAGGLAAAAEPEPRRGFRMPDIRSDLAALPAIFLSRKVMWLPPLLIFAGFLALTILSQQPELAEAEARDTSTAAIVFFVQFVFYPPPALLPIFLGGYFAPRAAYLVGAVLGLWHFILLLVAIVTVTGANGIVAPQLFPLFVMTVIVGAPLGAFAAWYRRFLQQGAERRQRVLAERAKAQKQQQRRGATGGR